MKGTVPEGPDFADVYDRNFAKVYNYVRYRVADRAAADDVTSRVFEKALSRLGSFDPGRASVEAWLFAIARNAVVDHFRAKKWLSWLPLDAFQERPGADPDGGDRLLEEESRHVLLKAIARLDDRQREIIALRFGAGMTNRSIASLLGLGESNVGIILYRALAKLKSLLKDAS